MTQQLSGRRVDLPQSGLVTFLFTDIEGSTKLVASIGDDAWDRVLAEHRRVILEAIASAQPPGVPWGAVGTEGDSLFVALGSPVAAVRGAGAAQRALLAASWPDGVAIRVRMGLHAGEALRSGDDYVGYEVHKAARVAAAAHGGQVILSRTMRDLLVGARADDLQARSLGVHRLKDVPDPEELFQLIAAGLPTEFPPPRTLDGRPNNLPVQLTTFVGRETLVDDVRHRLHGTRLLTLTGAGGTGKTRLALRVAEELLPEYRDGVWFVALAPIADPGLVPSTIASSLGIAEVAGRSTMDGLRTELESRETLVVLDNFEQLQAAAPIVTDLLRAAPGLTVLVTSRGPLHVSGERELAVPPLALPDLAHLPSIAALTQYEAVALFIERAQAVRPDFQVTNESAPAVAEICARLDGLPLALELAAARIRLLSPAAILARLGSRLELNGGARDLPARQQTLRGAIAWSHDLLEPGCRVLFARLSAFVGGATLEEVEAVCGPDEEIGGDLVDGLAALVDQSLVRRDEDADGEPRFWMLETIREFARERLEASGEADEIRGRHVRVYLALAEEAWPNLTKASAEHWIARLAGANENLRAALGWSIERADAETAMRFGWALWRFWQRRGALAEGGDWLARTLAIEGCERYPALHARAVEAAADIAYWRADWPEAERLYTQALEMARRIGDEAEIARCVYNLSFVYSIPFADIPRTESLLEEARQLYERLGDELGVANVVFSLNNVSVMKGDWASIPPRVTQAAEVFRRHGEWFNLGFALHFGGIAATELGDLEGARTQLTEAIENLHRAGDAASVAIILDDFAALERAQGRTLRSVRLAGAAATFARATGSDIATTINRTMARPEAGSYAEDDLRAAWAEGQAMDLDAAVAYALSEDDAR